MSVGAPTDAAARHDPASPMCWWVLAFAALAVSSSYYEDDVIGPIADLLVRQRGFHQSQLGLLNGIISVPNAVLALASGVLIDRLGAALAAALALWYRERGPNGHGLE